MTFQDIFFLMIYWYRLCVPLIFLGQNEFHAIIFLYIKYVSEHDLIFKLL